MAHQYQPRRFFRNAPNRLLQQYFASRKALGEVDFGALTDADQERLRRNAKRTIDHARAVFAKLPRPDLDNLPPEDDGK